jgi:ribosome-binding ATPase YchF (GTP1/OBG family)
MIEFALGFLVGIVAVYIVLKILSNIILNKLQSQLDNLDQEIESLNRFVQARVEEENGMFYIYNIKDNSFLAQGHSMQEIREKIESLNKGIVVTVTEGDDEVIKRLKETAVV